MSHAGPSQCGEFARQDRAIPREGTAKTQKIDKKKPKPKIRYQQDKDGTHIDFTI
jgi:hypothetical protein